MFQQHYDVIIIGESLASRIAAVLFAKQGYRVMTFQGENSSLPNWLTPSLHLERLLDALGGRSCYTSAAPFQVFTPDARIEFNGQMPLKEELRRELPDCDEAVLRLLTKLARGGERLEELLWKNAQALFSPIGRGLLALRRIMSRIGIGALNRSLQSLIEAQIPDTNGRQTLEALFSGMSLTSFNDLTVAEAALLWHCAIRPSGISSSGLDDLLRHRYEQFHGETENISVIKQLVARKKEISGITLKGGGGCAASCYLLADEAALDLFPAKKQRTAPNDVVRLLASPLNDRLSPLLARRMIVAGEPPLRLTIGKRQGDIACAIDLNRRRLAAGKLEKNLRERLMAVFPFAEYSLEESKDAELPHVNSRSNRFLGLTGSPRIGRNTFLASGAMLLPGLGSCGETLLGAALARHLTKRMKK